MLRADLLLIHQGRCESRTQAQRLIADGAVRYRDAAGCLQPVSKANQLLPEDSQFDISPSESLRYVSRGGLKLAGALAQAGVAVAGTTCLDIGQSTGGFTDCLLQAGAAHVVGVDVGHGQLHERLREDPRITVFEKQNARALPAAWRELTPGQHGFDLAVIDVSFISQTQVLPAVVPLLRPGGQLLSLVKPQFEAGREWLNRHGLVKDARAFALVEQRLRDACAAAGLVVLDYFPSPITGGDGNREFFISARKPQA